MSRRNRIVHPRLMLLPALLLGTLPWGGGCRRANDPAAADGRLNVSEEAVDRSVVNPPSGPSASGDQDRAVGPEGLSPDVSAPQLSRFRFVEMAKELGIEFGYRNGEEAGHRAIIENLGGGVAILDYDGDGWPDILAAGGGTISETQEISGLPFGLFRNRRQRFDAAVDLARFHPATDRYWHGITVWDYNCDGWDDVLVTGYGGASLMMNLGDGTYQDTTPEAFRCINGIATSAASGDISGDGFPDIYVATYVNWSFANHPVCRDPSGQYREWCSPKEFQGTPDYLFLNAADGTFVDCSQSCGLRRDGKGLGVLMADVDHDGDVDIYVANDTVDNFLYLNDGRGKLSEVGLLHGVALDERALPNGSMGISTCDVNGDELVDLWVANYERESFALYRNEGNANFLHTSRQYGIAALGGMYVGFGTDWEDFDLDGTEEIVVANGHVLQYPTAIPKRQKPLLLVRDGDRYAVQQFAPDDYFSGQYDGRGLAVGDLDRDGRSDIVISNINESLAVLLNRTPPGGQHVRIRLIGTQADRDAVGAHVVATAGSGRQLRSIVGGGSYLSHNQRVAAFGIPNGDRILSIEVQWPGGKEQTLADPPRGEEWVLVEPAAATPGD